MNPLGYQAQFALFLHGALCRRRLYRLDDDAMRGSYDDCSTAERRQGHADLR